MRRYFMMENADNKLIRIDRILSSVADVEKDPLKQKNYPLSRV